MYFRLGLVTYYLILVLETIAQTLLALASDFFAVPRPSICVEILFLFVFDDDQERCNLSLKSLRSFSEKASFQPLTFVLDLCSLSEELQ
jgi:hypothetical protein